MKNLFLFLVLSVNIGGVFAQNSSAINEEQGPIEENVAGVLPSLSLDFTTTDLQNNATQKNNNYPINSTLVLYKGPIEEEVFGAYINYTADQDVFTTASGGRVGVYPTLSKGELYVQTNHESLTTVEFRNIKGELVFTFLQPPYTAAPIDISRLPNCFYFVHAENEYYILKSKIVKQ